MSGGTTDEHKAFLSLCKKLRGMGAFRVRASGLEAQWPVVDLEPAEDEPFDDRPLSKTEREKFEELKAWQRMEEEVP